MPKGINLSLLLSTAASLVVLSVAAEAQQAAPAPDTLTDNGTGGAIEEVVVSGQRAAQKAAIETKKNADIILDSISADDAGKLPDNSVTEVLQRVPGVNITRIQTGGTSEQFLGEGTGITIRGLDSVVSQLNGRDSFSAANGRNLAWEDIPPELAEGVDVYKTEQPDLPEGGFGGTINLRTRQPFDFKGLDVQATIDDNYADYAKRGHPGGVLMASDTWDTPSGKFGLLANFSYSDLSTKADGVQISPYFPQVYDPTFTASNQTRLPYLGDPGASQVYVPAGINFNQSDDERIRKGYYLSGQWKPNNDLTVTTTFFRSEYDLTHLYHAMYVDGAADTILSPGSTNSFDGNGGLLSSNGLGNFIYVAPPATGSGSAVGIGTASGWAYQPIPYDFETSLSQTTNITTDYSASADWTPTDNLEVKVSFQHVDSSSVENDKYGYDYAFLPGYGLTLSGVGSPQLPVLTLPATGVNLSNPANYNWLATMDHLLDNEGTENAGYIDGTYELSQDGFFRSIKAGIKITSRSEDDDQTPFNYQALTPWFGTGINPATGLYQALSSFTPAAFKSLSGTNPLYSELFNIGSIFNGQTGLPAYAYFPSLAMLGTNFGTIHQLLGAPGDVTQPIGFVPADMSRMSESTEAAYLMVKFEDDNFAVPFQGTLGVRLVAYDDKAAGGIWAPYFTTPTSLRPVTTYNAPGGPGAIINNGQYQPNVIQYIAPPSAQLVSGGHSEVEALPALNFVAVPTPETKIRLGISEGESRPSFQQMNPAGSIFGTYVGTYDSYFNGTRGNPNLKPETAEQFDLSAEYYFNDGGLVTIAPFYKQIHNYISTEALATQVTIPTLIAGGTAGTVAGQGNDGCASVVLGAYCPQTVQATMVQPFNESQTASMAGIEFDIRKYFNFLPDPLDGLGIDFNYTYLHSEQPGALAYDMLGNRITGLPLTGLSKNTINVTGMYDKGPLELRLAWNWRDDFLVSTAAYQTSGSYNYINNLPPVGGQTAGQQGKTITYALPVFSMPLGTLDATIQYKLTDQFTWSLQASNLTDATTQLYMGTGKQQYNRSWYTADRRYETALHYAF